MFIQPSEIFTVNPEQREIDIRVARDFELEIEPEEPLSQNLSGIHVARGLNKNDFALFLTGVDNDGATFESFLMTHYLKRHRGIIVPSDEVIEYPNVHVSPELGQKMALLPDEEILQFGLGCLIDHVRQNFPNSK